MKTPWGWMLALLCVACSGTEDSICDHGTRGASRGLALGDIDRAQAMVKKQLSLTWEKALTMTPESSFDSGLPACVGRKTRAVARAMPSAWIGKTIGFAPADRPLPADVRVVTSARRISEVDAEALADPALIERLGVRCWPTRVRVLSEVELELVENP